VTGKPPILVWITGWPGTGKTTVGDFLEQTCGFLHIDVDCQFYFPHRFAGKDDTSSRSSTVAPWLKQWGDFFQGKSPLEEDFAPLLSEVCEEIRNRRASNPQLNIAVTQGLHREGRDFVRHSLKSKVGADVMFIGLTASLDKKATRLMYKEGRYKDLQGKNLATEFEERTGNALCAAAYVKDWKEQNKANIPLMQKMDVEVGEPNTLNINIDDDSEVLLQVTRALGVKAAKDVDVHTIAEGNWDRLKKFMRA